MAGASGGRDHRHRRDLEEQGKAAEWLERPDGRSSEELPNMGVVNQSCCAYQND